MFQDASRINLVCVCALLVSVGVIPECIDLGSAHCLCVLKIRNFFFQNIDIAGLIDIKLCCHKRPESMIHPDTGNAVSVCDKIAVTVTDDCGIGSVNADTAVIFSNHGSDILWIHQQKRKAVLPQITPASTSASIIVVRQERTSE